MFVLGVHVSYDVPMQIFEIEDEECPWSHAENENPKSKEGNRVHTSWFLSSLCAVLRHHRQKEISYEIEDERSAACRTCIPNENPKRATACHNPLSRTRPSIGDREYYLIRHADSLCPVRSSSYNRTLSR